MNSIIAPTAALTAPRTTLTGRAHHFGLRAQLAATARRVVYGAGVPATLAVQPVPDPADLFTTDELPPLADIQAAAEKFLRATEQTRAADRTKRAARKLLDRLPACRYGAWQVERVANAREVADLDAIRAIFKTHGLGDVPMKGCAPSLKVDLVPALAEVARTAQLLAA